MILYLLIIMFYLSIIMLGHNELPSEVNYVRSPANYDHAIRPVSVSLRVINGRIYTKLHVIILPYALPLFSNLLTPCLSFSPYHHYLHPLPHHTQSWPSATQLYLSQFFAFLPVVHIYFPVIFSTLNLSPFPLLCHLFTTNPSSQSS